MYVFFNGRMDVHLPDILIKGKMVQIVSDHKYLGIIIDSHLKTGEIDHPYSHIEP